MGSDWERDSDMGKPSGDEMNRLYGTPGHMVRRLKQKADRLFDAVRRRHGITSPQFAVLLTVSLKPGLEQNELAAVSHFDAATTGGIVARLETLSLVRREASRRSRRGRTLHLTAKGAAKLRRMEGAIARLQEDLLSPLTREERAQVMRLWRKVVGITEPPG